MNSKTLTLSMTWFMVLAIAFALIASTTFAESGKGKSGNEAATASSELRSNREGNLDAFSLKIKDNGEFRAKEVPVKAVNTSNNTITVNLFGSDRILSVAGATLLSRDGQPIALSAIKVGDISRLRGTFNSTANTVTLTRVDDRSLRLLSDADDRDIRDLSNADISFIQARIQALRDLIRELENMIANR